ncbi:GntR family transcriptional regulator [Priestia flexa]|jgi:GntR family transcriptional regulator|uniref:HTH gntR-type domain-containing protein n=2 Tax=Priestia TaxID=2800373 RepID=A0A0V8JMF1_9BACI|nr:MULTISPECIES: GntR family transcriptional regulator [Bacillaceae]AQX54691.1 hypothetical protein BC359_10465 [Priestia flexa]KSU88226.1 hypothetical protein AS180_08720 [Priestia veravalensis]KZB90972.1 hypothetical protein A2U94_13185 [Bacillus sp. VT 712]MBN8252159.1 GntR family transcriptional regulator [Priestia flexa]MBN8435104.1 GntR family transcriptional regulator [Priestia flexa]
MIDKSSSTPLYYQIKEMIKEKIMSTEWQAGSAIPSENTLSKLLSVSRLTVRQGIQELVDEGYLTRKRGVGTFVLENKIEQKLVAATSFTSLMHQKGKVPTSTILSIDEITASRSVKHNLALKDDSKVLSIKRIRYGDDVPVALETVFLPLEYRDYVLDNNITHSLHGFIEKNFNVKIGDAKQTVEATLANEQEANYLNLEMNAPLLLIKTVTYLTNNKPFEYVISVYAGERFKISSQIGELRTNQVM